MKVAPKVLTFVMWAPEEVVACLVAAAYGGACRRRAQTEFVLSLLEGQDVMKKFEAVQSFEKGKTEGAGVEQLPIHQIKRRMRTPTEMGGVMLLESWKASLRPYLRG